MNLMHVLVWAALCLASAISYASNTGQERPPTRSRERFAGIIDEHPAIQYNERRVTDSVARLLNALAAGTASLSYEPPAGYLRSLLQALDISPESQLLVFSKTGIQRANTSPSNPRALYFNDAVVVGYIAGSRFIEIAAHDPMQGVNFYTVDQLASAAPTLSRRTECVTCHVSGSTLDVPGLITRSNFTHATGELIPQLGFHVVDHRTPLSQRWGGWFVTGRYDLAPYGGVTHLGNVSTNLHSATGVAAGTSNEIFLRWRDVDAAGLGYPSHESDIAALMVFDHQARAINLLTRLNWEARVAAHEGRADYASGELRALADDLADYFLFADEVPPPARLTPREGFARHFAAAGPKDSRGRSLRQLDLEKRLLKYPCSWMIYSPAFDALPAAAKQAVYRRMKSILGGGTNKPASKVHLSAATRRAIREILAETKADWSSSR